MPTPPTLVWTPISRPSRSPSQTPRRWQVARIAVPYIIIKEEKAFGRRGSRRARKEPISGATKWLERYFSNGFSIGNMTGVIAAFQTWYPAGVIWIFPGMKHSGLGMPSGPMRGEVVSINLIQDWLSHSF